MPSYLLEVTKSLGKISQFEFLVMTEKNIFAYKLFLSLNISDFNLFFMWQLQPPEKSYPLFPSNPLWKLRSCQVPPFWKFGGSTPLPAERGGGAHYDITVKLIGNLWDNWNIPIYHALYRVIRLRFTCNERKIWSNIKEP